MYTALLCCGRPLTCAAANSSLSAILTMVRLTPCNASACDICYLKDGYLVAPSADGTVPAQVGW